MITVAILTFGLCWTVASCSKDNEPSTNSLIEGVWNCKEWNNTSWYSYYFFQEDICYLNPTNDVNDIGEEYKYKYDDKSQKLYLWEYGYDEDDGWYQDETPIILNVLKLTKDELWIDWGDGDIFQGKRIK